MKATILFIILGILVIALGPTPEETYDLNLYRVTYFNKFSCPRNINTYYKDEATRDKTPQKEAWCYTYIDNKTKEKY